MSADENMHLLLDRISESLSLLEKEFRKLGPSGRPGPAKLEFDERYNRWWIENQAEVNGLVKIEIEDKRESVYLFRCSGATVEISGKCKNIVVDTCRDTRVFFDSVLVSCEVVHSSKMHVHCRQSAPTVSIDNTDGIVLHLAPTSLHTEVVCSKSSETNLSWLSPEGGEIVEKPLPHQFVHRIDKNGAIASDVSDLYKV